MRGFPAYEQSGGHAQASTETSAHHAQVTQHPVYPNASPGGTRGRTRSPFLEGLERKLSIDSTASGFKLDAVKIAHGPGHGISSLHGLPNQHQDESQFHNQRSDRSPTVDLTSATGVSKQEHAGQGFSHRGQAGQGFSHRGQAGQGREDRGTGAKTQLHGTSYQTLSQNEQVAAQQGPSQAEEDLRQQLKNLLEFLKSGACSSYSLPA
jgi:hypothetical protein